jgi:valyl-tRNA synthetase
VRRFRTEQGLPDRKSVAARLTGLDAAGLSGHEGAVRTLNRLDEPGEAFSATATFEVATTGGPVTVELDTSGAIDVAAERARLGRDLAAAEKERDQADKKLTNPKFTEKAPADVVDGIRARRETALADIERVTARLAALPEA